MKTQITEQTLTFRPMGFTVAKSAGGFVLTLRCIGKAEGDWNITNIELACPFWWGQVLNMMSEAIANLKPHTPQPERGQPNGHDNPRPNGARRGAGHAQPAQG